MTADQVHDLRVKQEYEAIKGFYIHFLVYVCVNLLLVTIDVLGGDPMWSHWAVLGWGIGVLAHAYAAFVMKPAEMAKWEARQLAIIAGKS